MKHLILLCSIGAVLSSATAQEMVMQRDMQTEAAAAAQEGLSSLKRILEVEGQAEYLGLDSAKDLVGAELGTPYPVLLLRLDHLRAYGGGDPREVFTQTGHMLYPVERSGATKALIRVAPIDGEMKTVEVGLPNVARNLTKASTAAQERYDVASGGVYYVEALAQNMDFVAVESGGDVLMSPVSAAVMLDMEIGDFQDAETILRRLQVLSENIDPDVPR